MTETKKIRLQVNNAADVHFEGAVIQEYSTQSKDKDRPKSKWSELRLWETVGGAWIMESVGMSTVPGQVDIRDVLVIETGATETDEGLAHLRVMEWLGWTMVAKAFARQAGWNVIRTVK